MNKKAKNNNKKQPLSVGLPRCCPYNMDERVMLDPIVKVKLVQSDKSLYLASFLVSRYELNKAFNKELRLLNIFLSSYEV